jgi:hypothetical protein
MPSTLNKILDFRRQIFQNIQLAITSNYIDQHSSLELLLSLEVEDKKQVDDENIRLNNQIIISPNIHDCVNKITYHSSDCFINNTHSFEVMMHGVSQISSVGCTSYFVSSMFNMP